MGINWIYMVIISHYMFVIILPYTLNLYSVGDYIPINPPKWEKLQSLKKKKKYLGVSPSKYL